MERIRYTLIAIPVVFFTQIVFAQLTDDENFLSKKANIPKAIDFSQIFKDEKTTRDDFEALKKQKEAKLREQMTQPVALEKSVDPETYIIGPGDGFSFNIWGAMEMQHAIYVNPEGKILVPSVGEILVAGRTLEGVQKEVIDKSQPYYEKSKVSLTLESLRFFRVHVVGEVKFPGTYVAQAVNRISEMIASAGGVTERAWKREIELRRIGGSCKLFDLDGFEQSGGLEENLYVNGGDVVYVPPMTLSKDLVTVEGNFETSGIYQIFPMESVQEFLQRIRALKKNTDLSKIFLLRRTENDKNKKGFDRSIIPFHPDSINHAIQLLPGDKILLPSNFVYVKGSVLSPGAYPYLMNMQARDYAGMAGGDYRSSDIKGIKVYHIRTGKTKKGANEIIEPGDIVNIGQNLDERLKNYFSIFSVLISLLLAAKAAGIFGK